MGTKIFGRGMRRIALASMLAIGFVCVAGAQENTGKVQQGLVAGKVVSAEAQERYGLLTLSTGCSASLLRNNWAVTAAHCVDNPDPARPGAFIKVANNSVTLTANWSSVQQQQSVDIITFRPLDVAIIRVAAPFSVRGSTTNYARDVFRDYQFPYFGTPVGVPIIVFGRGINQFAQGSGAGATPSQSDGQYRVGYFKTTRQDRDYLYWYPSTNGQTIAGGDSGGPSFAEVRGGQVLVGVHSLCKVKCLAGQTCAPGNWMWVAETPECADAPLKPVWEEIKRHLNAFPAGPADSAGRAEPADPKPGYIGTFNPTMAGGFQLLYTVDRNGAMLWQRHRIGTERLGALGRPKPLPKSSWEGPKTVANGWGSFRDVMPGGQSIIYALTDDGDLNWYRHVGFRDGSVKWVGPVKVGTGWTTFAKIVPAGDGILYGIYPDGILRWYKHDLYKNAKGGAGDWAKSKNVAHGWNFKHVFSGGEGVLYFVNKDGKLMWTKHKAYLQAVEMPTGGAGSGMVASAQQLAWINSWEPPKEVGTGWGHFTKIISPGDGDIYAIQPNGDLYWYKHDGWRVGSTAWRGPAKIATGWNSFLFVVPDMLGTDSGPIVK
ncbi:MAG: tachylectin-related carbohydrate-binding protein [Acidobacteriota bacterium]|nr:tachylectin-related carbohydrate-binding protein [Acidobacteriota bacterium]